MATEILMPKLSDTMEEGKILRWLKQPGDRVQSGDLLAEVETDKANMEIEAFDEGVLAELRVAEGESAPVGAVIAVLGGAGAAGLEKPRAKTPAVRPSEAAPPQRGSAAPPAREPAPAPKGAPLAPAPRPAPVAERREVRASPLARKIASARGIELAGITGSGPGGRIVEKDVELAAGAAPAPVARPVVAGRRELSRTRKTTAKRMAEAKREIPHFYVSADLAMDEAEHVRESLLRLGGAFEGTTVTHLLVKACGLALRRVPEMNASLDGDGIVVHERVHVGIATATEEGLLVPVVRDVDRLSIAEVVEAVRAVVGRARAGKPAGDDLSGATFTISNLGMFPVSHFAAVVNPPQAAILAVGTIRSVPIVRDGTIVPGRVMTVTLSGDHRVVDGALAGRFLAELKTLVEGPLALVV